MRDGETRPAGNRKVIRFADILRACAIGVGGPEQRTDEDKEAEHDGPHRGGARSRPRKTERKQECRGLVVVRRRGAGPASARYWFPLSLKRKGGGAMRRYVLVAAVLAFFALLSAPATAAPSDDQATCQITCSVGQIMEWEGNFSNINLAQITSRTDAPTGSASVNLYTNGDVSVSADNGATAQLDDGGGSTLVTEYQLAYDGDGSGATGGTDVGWTAYGSFLDPASNVTHYSGDGVVQVTLSVRASNPTGDVADTGSYSATQTLTASWSG